MNVKLEEIRAAQVEEEKYVPHFENPLLPEEVVLDFSTKETQDCLLILKLLELRDKEMEDGMVAIGRRSAMYGMGGVGKSTTLRAICYEKEVQKAFPDGIFSWNLDEMRTTVVSSSGVQ